MADLVQIGKRIQERRKQKGYTQEQLADMMNVSIQMVSNLERGNKAIRIDNLINLCQILQISTDYILTGKESSLDLEELTALITNLSPRDQKMLEWIASYCAANNE